MRAAAAVGHGDLGRAGRGGPPGGPPTGPRVVVTFPPAFFAPKSHDGHFGMFMPIVSTGCFWRF